MLRIYLARHGQTDWNAARRLQGWTDVGLNETGRRQARDLARRLADVRLDGAFCSALRRSRETAEIVAGGRVPIESLPALNERRFGAFEGVCLDGGDPAVAAEFERRLADPEDGLGSGESAIAHRTRVRAAVLEILRRHAVGTILVVGHGLTNAAILSVLLDGAEPSRPQGAQANDEVYVVDVGPDGRSHVVLDRPPPA
jgi:broad specificity phosphatase PhoE